MSKENGWTLKETGEAVSTNDLARDFRPWHAVRADTQTSGRGRFGRTWISDPGGLWFSAVVPAPQSDLRWKILPLAAGLSAAETLAKIGVSQIRLRWPNDIMVGSRKCGGILLDRFHPETCVIGVGINIANAPEKEDKTLANQTISLSELLPAPPKPHDLCLAMLASLREITTLIANEGPSRVMERLEPFWRLPRRVEIILDDRVQPGFFLGVDGEGKLSLQDDNGNVRFYDPNQIKMLRDIEEV